MKKFPARFKRGACAIAAALLPWTPCITDAGGNPPAPAIEVPMQSPVPYTAKYSVMTSGTTVAEATYTLRRSGQGWEFRTHAKPTKMISWFISAEINEYSLVEIDGASVRPLRYQYEQKTDKEKDSKTLRAQYDWRNSTVAITDGKKTRQLAIENDTYDALSVQLALMQCMKNECREMRYSVIDEMELQQRRFERSGVEHVRTALGDHEAIRVSFRRGKRETITWLAPALNYIPVRVQQFRDGDLKTEMRITAATFE